MSQTATASQAPETAAAVCRQYEPSDDARAMLRDDMSPEAFLDALSGAGMYDDALDFTARWLPTREGVWWGCLCAWNVHRPQPPEPIEKALEAAVGWVLEPAEPNRRAAKAAGDGARLSTAAGALAMAAFYSGGSLTEPGQPEAAPPPGLAAATVAAAVRLAVYQGDPAGRVQRQRELLQLGLEVASGQNRWP